MGKDLFEKRKLEFIKFIQDKQRLPEAWEVSFSDGEDMHVWFNKLPEIPKFKVFKEEINKILYLEDYKKLLELQKQYEDGLITEDDMTIEQMDALHKLYLGQIKDLRETLSRKLVDKSREWYK